MTKQNERPNGVEMNGQWYAIDWQSFDAALSTDKPVFVDPHDPADHEPWECDAYGAFLESLAHKMSLLAHKAIFVAQKQENT